jgi:hypothetical protein
METASTSKTSVYFCQTTGGNNPEDSHPQVNIYGSLLEQNEISIYGETL